MSKQNLTASLQGLYNTYNGVIKPLIADIESRYQKFPLPIFNEIRAFNDHVAQCYRDEADDEIIKKEIYKAERHIVRIVLDCYKYLLVILHDKVKKFEKQTRNIDLTLIDNGEFYPKYKELYTKAVKQVRYSKVHESKNNGEAITEFEKAYNLYTTLEDLIDTKVNDVRWARIKFFSNRLFKIILWIIAAILSGIVSWIISEIFFPDLLNRFATV